MIQGSCHCGAVNLSVPARPVTITDCNCSICRRLGALWAYYPTDEVVIEGLEATGRYIQGDATLSTYHCKTCGCTTHWQGLGQYAHRMGINARLFDPAIVDHATVRKYDGASR